MTAARARRGAVAFAWGVLGFALPVLMLAAVSAWNGVYSFGPASFLTEDLLYQYVDFFTWFRAVLVGDESLFYSTAQALGANTWGLYSYYLASPFNLLVALFPVERVTLFVWVITALKLGCVQLAMTWFLRRRFGLSRGAALALALAFTWSSWTAAQLRNPLWLDALICLPLMATGAWALVREGRWRLLVGATAASIVVCWYTGYMTILFLCCYAVFECFLRCVDEPGFGWRGVARTAVRFAAAMVGALALAAFTFVPTVLAMMGDVSGRIAGEPVSGLPWGKALKLGAGLLGLGAVGVVAVVAALRWSRPAARRGLRPALAAGLLAVAAAALVVLERLHLLGVTCTLVDLASGFFLGGWRVNEVPQVSAGAVVLVLALVFLTCSRIDARKRAAAAWLGFALLASVWVTVLYCVWCGFRAPNGFYSRIGFFVVFLLVWMAAAGLAEGARGGLSRRRVAVCAGVVVALAAGLGLLGAVPWGCVLASAAVASLAAAGVVLASWTGARRVVRPAALSAGLAMLVGVELLFGAHLAWSQLYGIFTQEGQDAYAAESRDAQEALTGADPGIYRVAKTYTRAFDVALNEGLAAGYRDLSSYCSAHDGAAIYFLNSLGYSQEGQFSTRYAEPILPSDALLGVRYVWATEEPAGFVPTGEESALTGARLYRDPYALPLGYLVSPGAEGFSFDELGDPFTRQNAFASVLAGREVELFRPCEAVEEPAADGTRVWRAQVPEGAIGYAYVEASRRAGECQLVVDGGDPVLENARFQQSIHAVTGVTEAPVEVTVAMTFTNEGESLARDAEEARQAQDAAACLVWYLDMAAFEELVDELGARPLEVEAFSGAGIAGVVDGGAEGGLLMVSVPNDPGWTVRVNGQVVEAADIAGGALIGVPVGPGENRVEMTYLTPGLVPGCAMSGVALAVVVGLAVHERRCRRSV